MNLDNHLNFEVYFHSDGYILGCNIFTSGRLNTLIYNNYIIEELNFQEKKSGLTPFLPITVDFW